MGYESGLGDQGCCGEGVIGTMFFMGPFTYLYDLPIDFYDTRLSTLALIVRTKEGNHMWAPLLSSVYLQSRSLQCYQIKYRWSLSPDTWNALRSSVKFPPKQTRVVP